MLKPGGLSIPKSGMVPEVAGLLEFKTEGGVPELQVEMKLVIYGLVNYYRALKLMR